MSQYFQLQFDQVGLSGCKGKQGNKPQFEAELTTAITAGYLLSATRPLQRFLAGAPVLQSISACLAHSSTYRAAAHLDVRFPLLVSVIGSKT